MFVIEIGRNLDKETEELEKRFVEKVDNKMEKEM